jgi:hypothetical protein
VQREAEAEEDVVCSAAPTERIESQPISLRCRVLLGYDSANKLEVVQEKIPKYKSLQARILV